MLEKDIEKHLNDKVKKLGGRCYKFTSPGNAGVPDRLVLLPGGAIYFVELKTKYKKPRPLQKSQIRKLEMLGQDVRVLCGLDDVKEFVDEITRLPEVLCRKDS